MICVCVLRRRCRALLGAHLGTRRLRASVTLLKTQTQIILYIKNDREEEGLIFLYFEGFLGATKAAKESARSADRDTSLRNIKISDSLPKRLFDVGASFGRVPPLPIPNREVKAPLSHDTHRYGGESRMCRHQSAVLFA